jgi:hypothetical protein
VDAEHPLEAPAYHARRVVDRGWLPILREPPHVAYVAGHDPPGPRAARHRNRDLPHAVRVREDDRVRGVVLRPNLPATDRLDSLWREPPARAEKPSWCPWRRASRRLLLASGPAACWRRPARYVDRRRWRKGELAGLYERLACGATPSSAPGLSSRAASRWASAPQSVPRCRACTRLSSRGRRGSKATPEAERCAGSSLSGARARVGLADFEAPGGPARWQDRSRRARASW